MAQCRLFLPAFGRYVKLAAEDLIFKTKVSNRFQFQCKLKLTPLLSNFLFPQP